MIFLIGWQGTLENTQGQISSGFLHGDLLQFRGHLLVGLDILGVTVNA